MLVRALSGSGGGGGTISKDGGPDRLTPNVALRIKTRNAMVLVFNANDTSDAWTNNVNATVNWCCVYEGVWKSFATGSMGNAFFTNSSYDPITEILSVVTNDTRMSRYIIFGDYEILT